MADVAVAAEVAVAEIGPVAVDAQPDVLSLHLRFGVKTELGIFSDTLFFTEDEWAKRDEKAILQAKLNLADTWVKFRSEQIAEEQIMATDEGKKAKIAEYEARIVDLQAAADALKAA